MSVELTVPEVGESITEVQIGRWLKADGDSVAKDEDLVEIETDKASVVISAPEAGVLSIVTEEGAFANVGDVIARIEEGEGSDAGSGDSDASDTSGEREGADGAAESDVSAEAEGDAAQSGQQDDENGEGASDGDAKVMPAAARLLEEHGLKPDQVKATGPGGRILKEDVQRFINEGEARQAAKAALRDDDGNGLPSSERAGGPVADRDRGGDRREEVRPMSMIRRTIAKRLVEAQQNAALLTTFNEVDMQPVKELRGRYKEEFERKHDVKLGFMSFFVKASVAALQRFPAVNSEIRGTDVVTRHYYDVGIAVGGGKGLVVPVIRDADRLSFAEIERKIADLGARAQANEIQPEELEGGTFTISNGGIYGSLLSTPIVNPPQSGILGMHAIQERPVVRDGDIVVRPMMYVALTYDHRLIDGREAVTFLRTIKDVLEDPARLVLDL